MTRKQYQELYYLAHSNELRAIRIVKQAIEEGKIEYSECVDCGSQFNLIPWHENPDEPMNFHWVCKKCNNKRMKDITEYLNELEQKYISNEFFRKFGGNNEE